MHCACQLAMVIEIRSQQSDDLRKKMLGESGFLRSLKLEGEEQGKE
jgi:hypothetical protein